MQAHAESIRKRLAQGPATPRQLIDLIGFSQASLSRALVHLGPDLVSTGAPPDPFSISCKTRPAGCPISVFTE
jgi:hypothetical protein